MDCHRVHHPPEWATTGIPGPLRFMCLSSTAHSQSYASRYLLKIVSSNHPRQLKSYCELRFFVQTHQWDKSAGSTIHTQQQKYAQKYIVAEHYTQRMLSVQEFPSSALFWFVWRVRWSWFCAQEKTVGGHLLNLQLGFCRSVVTMYM